MDNNIEYRKETQKKCLRTTLFKVGDVVKLKAGSYPMTVQRVIDWREQTTIYAELGIECVWHDSSGVLHNCRFDAQSLIKLDDIN